MRTVIRSDFVSGFGEMFLFLFHLARCKAGVYSLLFCEARLVSTALRDRRNEEQLL